MFYGFPRSPVHSGDLGSGALSLTDQTWALHTLKPWAVCWDTTIAAHTHTHTLPPESTTRNQGRVSNSLHMWRWGTTSIGYLLNTETETFTHEWARVQILSRPLCPTQTSSGQNSTLFGKKRSQTEEQITALNVNVNQNINCEKRKWTSR